jgi:serine kinase of HPr protein (carbohydrate metabolism regulator)
MTDPLSSGAPGETGEVSELQHATCVSLAGRGVLLRGPSGSGKSDLAFRLIRGPWAARLVADDQTLIGNLAGELVATAPEALQGLLELRGLGLVKVPFAPHARLSLVINLVARDDVPRMPDPAVFSLCGVDLPQITLHAFDATSPDKVGLAAELIPVRGFPREDGVIGPLV